MKSTRNTLTQMGSCQNNFSIRKLCHMPMTLQCTASSNDRRVLNLKRAYEQKYPSGYFIIKRGETPPADKDKTLAVDLVALGKDLISWHSQRPNVAYSETKIFDKYFEQLFKREYRPENVHALNDWMNKVWKQWAKENPLGLNESLLAMTHAS